MAIRKKVPDNRPHAPPNKTRDVTQPVFAYPPTDGLAQVIVDLWTQPAGHIFDRDNRGNPTAQAVQEATDKINGAGFDLKRAVIISEAEHDDDYTMGADTEVVFSLAESKPSRNKQSHALASRFGQIADGMHAERDLALLRMGLR